MTSNPGEITQLLRLWRSGNQAAESKLFELLAPDLRKMARGYFRRERDGHTLQPTALVNEAFLRLATAKHLDWQDRAHFFAVSARIMRRYLVDYARAKPIANVPLYLIEEKPLGGQFQVELALAVDVLLDDLGKESPRRRTVVELKFFLGLTDQEAAEALNLTLHTFQREWSRARRWLFERLESKERKAEGNSANG